MKTMTKEEKKIRTEQTLSFLKDLKKMDTEDRRKNMMKLIVSYNMSIVEVEVSKILRVGYNQSYSKEELFNEGILGLYDAVKNFDCEKSKDSFYAYASLYVKGQIFTFITNNKRPVRMPIELEREIAIAQKWLNENFMKDGFICNYPEYVDQMKKDLKGKIRESKFDFIVNFLSNSPYTDSTPTDEYQTGQGEWIVVKPDYTSKRVLESMQIKRMMALLDKTEQLVCAKLVEGLKANEIASVYGMNYKKVIQTKKNIKEKWIQFV